MKNIKKAVNLLLAFLFSFTILLAEQTDTTFTGRVYEDPHAEGKNGKRK